MHLYEVHRGLYYNRVFHGLRELWILYHTFVEGRNVSRNCCFGIYEPGSLLSGLACFTRLH